MIECGWGLKELSGESLYLPILASEDFSWIFWVEITEGKI
jgi:hypothetical protein